MRKGFTLAELLAVMVLLSALALIAVPVILDIIKDTRKDSAVRSAELYIDAAENIALYRETAGTGKREVEIGVVYNHEVLEEVFELKVDGSIPSEDSWVIFDKYGVVDYSLKFGNYVISYNEETEKEEVTQNNSVNSVEYKVYDKGDKVKLVIGSDQESIWYVMKDEGASSNTLLLIKEKNINNSIVYDENGTSVYENATIKNVVEDYGKSLNLGTLLKEARIIKAQEVAEVLDIEYNVYGFSFDGSHFISSSIAGGEYWTSTNYSNRIQSVTATSLTNHMVSSAPSTLKAIRPVIKVSKGAIEK